MLQKPVYMDNHATTRTDPRVLETMLPCFGESFGNAGSAHSFGWKAKQAVNGARETVARALGASPKEIVFTSGATESNNLAIRGVAEKYARKAGCPGHLIGVVTEHPSVLDPLEKLRRRGYEVTLLPVIQTPDDRAGCILAEQVAEALRDDTILVSVMLANNEIGAVHPVAEIGRTCKQRGVLLHCDATQAVGRIPVDVQKLQVDLLGLSAHKLYGPKGVGALYVRRRSPLVRLEPIVDGGGQESGLRSGTLNVPGIVGLARAVELCLEEMPVEQPRLQALRDRLYRGLTGQLSGVTLNGPSLELPGLRLSGNLSASFAHVDGEALLMSMKDLAVSTGSACTSAEPEPSHVLRGLGIGQDQTRGSVRFGLGRFNTEAEVDFAIETVSETVTRLRKMSA